jgi:hypothetical protein
MGTCLKNSENPEGELRTKYKQKKSIVDYEKRKSPMKKNNNENLKFQ